MDINEFNDKLNDIRARNGWIIELELHGIWSVRIYDKESGDILASTGMTGLGGLLQLLEIPLEHPVWYKCEKGE